MKPSTVVCQILRGDWFYDRFAADRSLVPRQRLQVMNAGLYARRQSRREAFNLVCQRLHGDRVRSLVPRQRLQTLGGNV